jgi:hypothetical protein
MICAHLLRAPFAYAVYLRRLLALPASRRYHQEGNGQDVAETDEANLRRLVLEPVLTRQCTATRYGFINVDEIISTSAVNNVGCTMFHAGKFGRRAQDVYRS